MMTDYSQKTTPVICGALFAVGNKVQICWANVEARYRGQGQRQE